MYSSRAFSLFFSQSKFLGVGDWHEEKHNDTERIVPLFAQNSSNHTAEAVAAATASGHCMYSLHLFYSDSFASAEKSHFATIATAAIATIFGLMAIAFFLYDYMVHKRNKKIVCVAATSNAFLSTLFPTDVRNRLLDAEAAEAADNDDDKKGRGAAAPQLQRMMEAGRFPMEDDTDAQPTFKSKPIADLFNETTVLFADICGFSAWSSVREPSQV
jgi:hypothetical protein